MDATEIVRKVAADMRMLDADGALQKDIGSMALIDFVLELERVADVEIPTDSVRPDNFRSIETVVALLSSLKA